MINTVIQIERFNLFYGAYGLMAETKSQINCFQNPPLEYTYSINTIHREKYRQLINAII